MNLNDDLSPPVGSAGASPRTHRHTVRVYWEDTDAGGVVYYANYLRFFERARTEWLRRLGHGQQALVEQTGAQFVVARADVRYLKPARLDDSLQVDVDVTEVGRSRLVVRQQALRGDEVLCQGIIEIACVDRDSFRPRRIPSQILASLATP